jgi:peptidoglycan hydrolase-like protein with peptidoglycan-binding domain
MNKKLLVLVLAMLSFLSIQTVLALNAQDEVLIGENRKYAFDPIKKTLKVGDNDEEVIKLQKFLIYKGYLTLSTGPTGYYGPKTVEAVKKYQIENNIINVGSIGPQTLTTINETIESSLVEPVTKNTNSTSSANIKDPEENSVSGGLPIFSEKLGLGARGYEVTKLQKFLKDRNFFEGPTTGYFGFQTREALLKFQRKNSVGEFGSIGPRTISVLNTGKIPERVDISQIQEITTQVTNTTNLSSTAGSVTVTITPESAVTKGAKWKIDNGDLNTSNTSILNITPGVHTISFTPIISHIKPADIKITVSADSPTTATGIYIPAYDILEQTVFEKQGLNNIRYKLCLNPLIYTTTSLPILIPTDRIFKINMNWINNQPFNTPFFGSMQGNINMVAGQLCGLGNPFTFQSSFSGYTLSSTPPFGINAVIYPSSYVTPNFNSATIIPSPTDLTIDPAFTGSPGI